MVSEGQERGELDMGRGQEKDKGKKIKDYSQKSKELERWQCNR